MPAIDRPANQQIKGPLGLSLKHIWAPIWSHYGPILILLIGGFILGYLIVADYGKSLDEDYLMVYGRQTIQIYRGDRDPTDTIGNLNFYGPVYSLLVEIGRFKLERLHPDWMDAEARHFSYFLTFLVALFFLYDLCIRFVSKYAAIGATLLFASQPVIFGHAFINPKDIPFMAFFLGSVALGFRAAERLYVLTGPKPNRQLMEQPARELQAPKVDRRAARSGPLWDVGVLVLAAAFLGLCTNVRVLGFFAGGLVSIYLLARGRLKSIWALALYWGVALAFLYATWPFLWGDPLQNFWKSLEIMTNFPSVWTFYRGQSFAPTELPWYYLPHLMAIQLTLPAILLGTLGLFYAYRKGIGPVIAQLDRHLIVLWLAVPILYFILARTHIYDNFRQLLFIVPPIFVLGGIGLQAVLQSVKGRAIKSVLLILVLLPGILALIRLHPYQYVYYNALVGGVRGAFQDYPLDYWCTSSREAIEHVNTIAPPGATVRFNVLQDLITPYAREDLTIIGRYSVPESDIDSEQADLIISCLRGPKILKDPDQTILWQLERDGVPLTVVMTNSE